MNDRATDPLAEHRRVNRDGTERLARAAVAAGVRRFVYLSTVKVNGERTGANAFRASDPPLPADPYGIAKSEAESALFQIAASSTLEPVVIRPTLVYGPGVKGNFLDLLRAVDRRLPLPLGGIRNRRSLVGRTNLIDLIRHCLCREEKTQGTFLVSDGDDLSTPELVRRIGAALGRRVALPRVSPQLLRQVAGLIGRRASVDRLVESLYVDIGPTCEALGWRPPQSVAGELALTAAWFRRRGL